jgi:hypothetical protein
MVAKARFDAAKVEPVQGLGMDGCGSIWNPALTLSRGAI